MRLKFILHYCVTQWIFGLDFAEFPEWGTLYLGPCALTWARDG